MLTEERMEIAREVLEALAEISRDLAGDNMAIGERGLAADCIMDAVICDKAIEVINSHGLIE